MRSTSCTPKKLFSIVALWPFVPRLTLHMRLFRFCFCFPHARSTQPPPTSPNFEMPKRKAEHVETLVEEQAPRKMSTPKKSGRSLSCTLSVEPQGCSCKDADLGLSALYRSLSIVCDLAPPSTTTAAFTTYLHQVPLSRCTFGNTRSRLPLYTRARPGIPPFSLFV